jgi:hypothetical protein
MPQPTFSNSLDITLRLSNSLTPHSDRKDRCRADRQHPCGADLRHGRRGERGRPAAGRCADNGCGYDRGRGEDKARSIKVRAAMSSVAPSACRAASKATESAAVAHRACIKSKARPISSARSSGSAEIEKAVLVSVVASGMVDMRSRFQRVVDGVMMVRRAMAARAVKVRVAERLADQALRCQNGVDADHAHSSM